MRKALPLLFLLLLGLAGGPLAQAGQAGQAGGSLDDTARLLAGMPVSGGSPLAPLMQDAAWRQHADYFGKAWTKLETRQLAKIREWAGGNLRRHSGTVFYMFSGPDFLYANAFFPHAENYILCGIEPVGSVPDATKLNLGGALYKLQGSLNSVLNYSFFQTRQMREDFGGTELNGTIPILMVFLARSGKTITNITPQSHGVRIDYAGGSLYYFCVDLSNGSVEHSGLLSFCRKFGQGDSLVKSASYLMHQSNFSTIRDFLLEQSSVIVQDDTGIPYRNIDPNRFQVRLYGDYKPPIDIFKQYFQPELADAYAHSNPAPLPFGVGYRGWDPAKSALIVAWRR